MLRLIVLVASVVSALGQTTNVQRCTGSAAQGADPPINAYVEGCVNPPCALAQLDHAVVHLVFRAPRTIRSMTTRAQAFLLFIPIDYPLQEHAVTCNFLTNSFCPIMEGEVVQYTLRMKIEEFFPVGVSPTVEFRIVDDDAGPITCIRVPITIVPPVNPGRH